MFGKVFISCIIGGLAALAVATVLSSQTQKPERQEPVSVPWVPPVQADETDNANLLLEKRARAVQAQEQASANRSTGAEPTAPRENASSPSKSIMLVPQERRRLYLVA